MEYPRTSRMTWKLCLLAAALAVSCLGAVRGAYRLLPQLAGPCQADSGCVPLVLIHGIHGTSMSGACGPDAPVGSDCNWAPLLAHLSQRYPALYAKLRVWVFRYPSDQGDSVIEIGRQLRDLVNSEPDLWREPLLIVAQSMGGIVARAFLDYQPHPFAPKGSRLTRAMITLGTPHHGTPLANRILRDRLAERIIGGPVTHFALFDLFYWGWHASPHLAHNAEEPNRSDLLWDDYDGLFAELREDLAAGSLETNHSLEHLRGAPDDETALVVYGGYLQFDGEIAVEARRTDDLGQLLRTAGRLLRNQLGMAWNDGFVPLDSALFAGNPSVAERRIFPGYDHRDMMGNHVPIDDSPARRIALLDRIALDIAAACDPVSASIAAESLRSPPAPAGPHQSR